MRRAYLSISCVSSNFEFQRFQPSGYHSLPDIHHAKSVKDGCLHHLNVGNYVVSLYMKSRNLEYAHKLFGEMPERDVRSWTILISGFARTGACRTVLELFKGMQAERVCPNQFTLSSVLKSCSSLSDFRMGKGVHGWILRNGIELDVVLENSMLDVYVKCGELDYAERLFETMKERDTVTWNIMMGAYMHVGDMEKALELFRRLPSKDVASWNTIVYGLMQNGDGRSALELLYEMVENGVAFEDVTFSVAVGLASSLYVLELGTQIHGYLVRRGIENDGFLRTSLIDMYCKFGRMDKASLIFKRMPVRAKSKFTSEEMKTEIVSWSSMVSGYVRNGEHEYALITFRSMLREKIMVDRFSVTSVVSACANLGILLLGQNIHAVVQKIGYILDVHLGSCYIDMYAKCGSLSDALMIFEQTIDPNVVLWTSTISACALHGQGKEAIRLFELMIREGIKPNEVTFVVVLNACSHAGLIEEGFKYFSLMKEVYGIKPGTEHFTCMVDLYGRAGRLEETKEFIHANDISHLSSVWKSFLSACRLHKNLELGKWVSEKLLQLEPSDEGPYVLMSNMCAVNHRWEEAAAMRRLMQQRGINKVPGQSWIQLKNQVHSFAMGDRCHPHSTQIYSYLDELIARLKAIGYSMDAKLVMQDVEEEQGEALLGHHSEKLAIAYGIISTASGIPIRIMKNLRVCSDCHNFIKYTSQLLDREIIVRDLHRFHHFKHGSCSCGDYW
ncbi:putative tetratricopeptide-like helical domain, DYW domain-containing protein [Rosa chinensis]|uniref:Putative tetratricopeptide-like helical domain, DYW domain-containing protein n=1 Tax=Rosa chinensis TaxID=74649 RepID=A0A2P6R580_ROSCH|nr:putative tetratricopeptide-like helical domain, DYW domain-containing protein [Rosa chinensis]